MEDEVAFWLFELRAVIRFDALNELDTDRRRRSHVCYRAPSESWFNAFHWLFIGVGGVFDRTLSNLPVLGRLEARLPFEEARNAVDFWTPECLQPFQHRGRDAGLVLQQVLGFGWVAIETEQVHRSDAAGLTYLSNHATKRFNRSR